MYNVYIYVKVMRMRLLVDGDGLGDDRRLNMLLKVFVNAKMIKNIFLVLGPFYVYCFQN